MKRSRIEALVRFIDGVSRAAALVSSFFMVVIVALIVVEIFLRGALSTSTLIADESSAYFFVAVVLLGLGYTLSQEGHIRITLVWGRLSHIARRYLDMAVILAALVLCTFALYHAVLMVWDAYVLEMNADSISETPVWIPQALVPLGLFLFDLQLVAEFLRRLPSFPTR
jgi:TRAP-type mannitol/chloroaromatic compound transport system permease small subunit